MNCEMTATSLNPVSQCVFLLLGVIVMSGLGRRIVAVGALTALVFSVIGTLSSATQGADENTWKSPPCRTSGGEIVFRVVMVEDENEDPMAAGKAAAKKLLAAMGDHPLKAVLVSECFEDWEFKQPLLKGICSVISPDLVYGGATYGSFSQDGCAGFDAVCLLGIGGDGIGVSASLVAEMGVSKLTFEDHEAEIKERLHTAGASLATQLPRSGRDRLTVLIADAHSPKNQYLVEGLQKVLGGDFPITGGSANKNAGQTFVYFRGKAYRDSALALMLSGDFRVAMTGRKAMDNDAVVATAREAAREASRALQGKPLGVLAFNCAGRRGKLKDPQDELDAIQAVLGKDLPMFGCYCAGEIGPLDVSEKAADVLSGGSGWHVMFTVIGR